MFPYMCIVCIVLVISTSIDYIYNMIHDDYFITLRNTQIILKPLTVRF